MDWRGPVRKLVNREDYLSPWRLVVMRVVDPVEWYMRKNDEMNVRPASHRPARRPGRGWTAHGPVDERDHEGRHDVVEGLGRRRVASRAAREALRREYGPFFEAKARELLDRHEVRVEWVTSRMEAKLVRFRNGAVFEQAHASAHERGTGMTRIERDQLSNPVAILARLIESAVLSAGAEAGPLT